MNVPVIAPESDDRDGRATLLDPELPHWTQNLPQFRALWRVSELIRPSLDPFLMLAVVPAAVIYDSLSSSAFAQEQP